MRKISCSTCHGEGAGRHGRCQDCKGQGFFNSESSFMPTELSIKTAVIMLRKGQTLLNKSPHNNITD